MRIALVFICVAGMAPPLAAQSPQPADHDVGAETRVLALIDRAKREDAGNGAQQDAAYLLATQALETARGLAPEARRRVAAPLTELLLATGRPDDVELYLLSMLEDAIRLGGAASPEALDRLSLLGDHYHAIADYGEAERHRLRVIALAEQLHGIAHARTVEAVGDLARTMVEATRPIDADGIVTRHFEGARALGEDHPERRRALLHMAILRDQQEQYEEAERLYDLLTAAPPTPDPAIREIWIDAASRLMVRRLASNRIQEASALLQRAAPVRDDLPARHRGRLLIAMADALLRSLDGDVRGATEMLYLAEQEDTRRFSHPDITAATTLAARLQLLEPALVADAVENSRRLVSALLDRDSVVLSRARRGTSSFADAQIAREARNRREIYALMIDAAWAGYSSPPADRGPLFPEPGTLIGDAVEAIQMLESNPAGKAMTEMALRSAAERRGAGLGALVRERQALEQAFERLGVDQLLDLTLAGGEGTAPTQAAVERDRIEERIAEIDGQLRAAFPQFAHLSRPGPLIAQQIIDMLAEDEAVLMLAPGAAGTDVIVIGTQGMGWHRAEWNAERVSAAVRRLLWNSGASVEATPDELAAWRQETGDGAGFDRQSAHDLHQSLIAPVMPGLEGKRHLFVYATGSLAALPLGILVAEPPQGRDDDPEALRATRWLADQFAISHIPSLQAFHLLRESGEPGPAAGASDAFAGFGDPVLAGTAESRGGTRGAPLVPSDILSPRRGALGLPLADVRALTRLARLPGTATELEQMRVALGAPIEAVRLREQATERAIRTANLGGVRVITFATHGLTAGEIDGAVEPGLVLTPPAEASDEDDGLLTASEIAGLTLDAEWVILSACNSAAGDGAGGGGLSGLARAFFYAGARALLASHWPVRDDVAARLTARAIQLERSRPELSRAEAFGLAMREIRNDPTHDWSHPNAWAPFSLFGDGAR